MAQTHETVPLDWGALYPTTARGRKELGVGGDEEGAVVISGRAFLRCDSGHPFAKALSPGGRLAFLLKYGSGQAKGQPVILDLAGCGIGDMEVHVLVECLPAIRRIRSLRLDDNYVTAAGLRALVRGGDWASLEELSLANNPLGPSGARELAQGAFPRILKLSLDRCELGDRGVAHLATTRSGKAILQRLMFLTLTQNHLTSRSVDYLYGIQGEMMGLRELRLGGNEFAPGATELLRREGKRVLV